MTGRRRPVLAALGAAVSLALLLLLAWGLRQSTRVPTTFDDAYVFCRYADHLLAGHGLAWNPGGPQTYGCTSLLYTFWIALLKAATGLPCFKALAWGSFLPALAAVFVTALACRRAALRVEALRLFPAALGYVCLTTCLTGGFRFHAAKGMDTTLAILSNALVILAVVRPAAAWTPARLALAAAASYLSFLARPDNLVYAFMFPALYIVLSDLSRRERLRAVCLFGALLGGLLLADGVVKELVFGSPLPLPFYVKSDLLHGGLLKPSRFNPFLYSQFFLLRQAIPIALIALFLTRRSLRLVAAALVPFLLLFVYFLFTFQVMGYAGRFYYPGLPFFVVAGYHVLDDALDRAARGGLRPAPRTAAIRAAALALLALMILPGLGRLGARYDEAFASVAAQEESRRPHPALRPPRELGWWDDIQAVNYLVKSCPREVVWAMSEHGFISAANPDVTIVDLTGLHDRDTMKGVGIYEQVMQDLPDAIWLPHAHAAALVHALETSAEFARLYDYWPRCLDYGFAVRKDSPYRPQILRAARQVWLSAYGAPCPGPAGPATP